jgi:hypothetical protein
MSSIESPLPSFGSASRRRPDLVGECRDLIVQRLTQVIADALQTISDELTAQALRAEVAERRELLLDAVMLVREGRLEFEGLFQRHFIDTFLRRLDPDRVESSPATSDAPVELSLLSEDSLLDSIEVGKLAQRAGNALDPDQVLGIRARLAALVDRDWFDESCHPVSPEAVFDALKASLGELSAKAEVRSALLSAFEPHVTRSLNGIYEAVNERLVSNHVLPRIRPQVRVTGDGPRRAPAASLAQGASEEGAQRVAQHAAPGSSAVGHSPSGAGGGPADSGALMAELNQAMERASAGLPAGRRQVARMLSNPAAFGVADIPLAPVVAPLVDALTDLQREGDLDGGSTQLPAIVQRIRAQGSPLDQVTCEIVALVFDYIYSDRRLPDSVKQQLLRLQVVAVKAALLDRGFFARRQHPLRRLIDRISDLGADPDADTASGAPLVSGLGCVMDRVIAEFVTDLSVFEDALLQVDALAREEGERRTAKRAQALREAAMREALAIARDEAWVEVERRLDREVPAFVRGFLSKWWVDVMARARCSRDSEAGARAWEVGVRAAEYLIWSVLPKQSEEIARLAAVLPGMMRGINRGLDLIEMPEADRTAFFEELMRTHTREIEAAKRRVGPGLPARPAVAVRLAPDGSIRFVPKTEIADKPVGAPAPSESDSLLAGLQRGQYLDLHDASGVRTLKLAWVSPARKLFILSRYPDESLTFEASELLGRLRTGEIVRSADGMTMERAIDRVASESAGDTVTRSETAELV